MALPAESYIRDVKDIVSIAKECGIEIKVSKKKNHAMYRMEAAAKLDPDIMYLHAPGHRFPSPDNTGRPINGVAPVMDCMLLYHGELYGISWGEQSKAAIRKKYTAPDSEECIVCYGELKIGHCPECNAAVCSDCLLKLTLTPEAIQTVFAGCFEIPAKCPECRAELGIDVRNYIYAVDMERLHDFPKATRGVLRFLRTAVPKFEERSAEIKAVCKIKKDCKARGFKKGCAIKLQRLKKTEWNGEKAMITGGKIVRNYVIRWPIRLLNGTKAEAKVKQCNLRKI